MSAIAIAACSPSNETAQQPPLEGADIGGPFELVNKDATPVKWADFDGQYRIVYFGFTYCPDICPNDVSRMIRGLDRFAGDEPELAAQIQPIFVSVDPERDTPEIVGEFAAAFSDDLIGLTGTPEQVKSAADNFRVFYSRGEDTPGGGYLVDHSAIVYLFGKSGEPLATLPTDQGADAVAAELAKWVR
ncbi:MAG: SCO family protein [Erythrobacter sp.]